MKDEELLQSAARLLAGIRHLHGPRRAPAGGVVVVCLVRDGADYLDAFLEHYFSLGARHIVFLDNGSRDGTVQRAGKRRNVTVLRTKARLDCNELLLRRHLAHRYAEGRWCLCADIDEFFDYPFSGAVKLDALTAYLEAHSYTAVVTQMLDLFSSRPLDELRGRAFRRADYDRYDLSALSRLDYFSGPVGALMKGNTLGRRGIRFHVGGVRKSVFGTDNWLTKHQLFLGDAVELLDAHRVRGARCADFTAACLHYKLTPSLYERTRDYVKRGFGAAPREYRAILRVPESPRMFSDRAAARTLSSIEQLLEEGFLLASARFARWAQGTVDPR